MTNRGQKYTKYEIHVFKSQVTVCETLVHVCPFHIVEHLLKLDTAVKCSKEVTQKR